MNVLHYHHVAGARWISYSFSSALSFSPEIYLLMGCCCTNVSCIGISLFVAVKYFTLDPNCTFKNISRCNITHAHLIPGGENTDFYCYCCIVTHPICVSNEAAASLKKVIASLQLPSPGSFISNFLQGFTSFKLSAIFVAVVYHEQGLFCNISRRH